MNCLKQGHDHLDCRADENKREGNPIVKVGNSNCIQQNNTTLKQQVIWVQKQINKEEQKQSYKGKIGHVDGRSEEVEGVSIQQKLEMRLASGKKLCSKGNQVTKRKILKRNL